MTSPAKPTGRKTQQRRRQVAALPWRAAGPGIEILLVSSRETRRWVIPKGWPMKGKADHDAAAREAFEEAGVSGVIKPEGLGGYDYLKRLKSGAARGVRVEVFALAVDTLHDAWPEQGQRTLKWMDPVEAAVSVQEPELRDLIARFAGVSLPAEERPDPPPPPTPLRIALQRLRRRVTALWGRGRD